MVDPRVALGARALRPRRGRGGGDVYVYDARLATAVAAFQRANGLPPNGALTPATVDAPLSGGAGPARREAMILANMEMWRWEPRAMGDERIEINIPDYSLKVMNGDDLVHQARVIVGKPDTPTPIFSNEMRYILVNPIWRVPDSIIKKEMAPKLAQDPDLSHPARIRGEPGGRSARRSPAARRGQRARTHSLHVPQRTCRLSSRYARARRCSRRLGGLSAMAACASSSRCAWPNW